MVQTSEVRVGRDATDGLNSTLDVATGQPRGAPMKHGGRVLGALFDKAEARMLSLGFIQLYVLVIVRLARRELVWINVTSVLVITNLLIFFVEITRLPVRRVIREDRAAPAGDLPVAQGRGAARRRSPPGQNYDVGQSYRFDRGCRALLALWARDTAGRPMLALLCALACDPSLRDGAAAVPGTQVRWAAIASALESGPSWRENAKSLAQNAACSWTQAGFLVGAVQNVRVRAKPTPTVAAYAALIASLCGILWPGAARKPMAKSCSVLACRTWSCSRRVLAAAFKAREKCSAMLGLARLTSRAMMAAVGINSCSNSSRFGPTSTFKLVIPVRFPPGRFRPVTSPILTGSTATAKTIGMVAVDALAATAEGVPPAAAITST